MSDTEETQKTPFTKEELDQITDHMIDRLKNDKNFQKELGDMVLKGIDPYLQKFGGLNGIKNLLKSFGIKL